ncbi:hypothetical protein EON64_18995 [archaeon]|nr:MAG: hypothetical protein EON64_18995 [archaeon]
MKRNSAYLTPSTITTFLPLVDENALAALTVLIVASLELFILTFLLSKPSSTPLIVELDCATTDPRQRGHTTQNLGI